MISVIFLDIAGLLAGTALGCLLRQYVPEKLQENSMIYFAVIMVALSIGMIGKASDFPVVVIAFLLGGIAGHFLKIDQRVSALPEKITSKKNAVRINILMSGFTVFCICTTGMIGAMELRLTQNTTLIFTKAIMDFLGAVFLAAAGAGWIQALIAIPLSIVLFGFYFLAGVIAPYLTPEVIGNFSACGGMISMVNALRLAKLKDPPVLDLIPALIFVILLSFLR